MRILYGVAGEGLGHAMRSRVVAEHLRSRGHEVKLVSSGQRVRISRAFVRGCPADSRICVRLPWRAALAVSLARAARPRCGARDPRVDRALPRRDLEVLAGRVHQRFRLVHAHLRPLVRPPGDLARSSARRRSLRACGPAALQASPLTRAVVRGKLPGCRHYIVSSFYFPGAASLELHARQRADLARRSAQQLEPTLGDHVLVYQTAAITAELVAALRAVPEQRFVVYSRGSARR